MRCWFLMLLLISGCTRAQPPEPPQLGMFRYRDYAEAPDAWEYVCHDPAYPFVSGETITNALLLRLQEVVECVGSHCSFPEASEINQRCQMVRSRP